MRPSQMSGAAYVFSGGNKVSENSPLTMNLGALASLPAVGNASPARMPALPGATGPFRGSKREFVRGILTPALSPRERENRVQSLYLTFPGTLSNWICDKVTETKCPTKER